MSEKSTRNDVDYAAKSRMARHRAVVRWLMQFRLANSLPSSTLSAIQRWRSQFRDRSSRQDGRTRILTLCWQRMSLDDQPSPLSQVVAFWTSLER